MKNNVLKFFFKLNKSFDCYNFFKVQNFKNFIMFFPIISFDVNLNAFVSLLIFLFFLVGLFGIIASRSNFLIILMSIEIMLLSINLNLLVYSTLFNDVVGYMFGVFILSVAAAESAIGLGILTVFYRIKGTITLSHIAHIKG